MSAEQMPHRRTQRFRRSIFSQRGLLLLGLLVGFALRLRHLGAESLWYDEAVSVYLARQTIPDLIAHTARDIHPPGYYLLLHVWRQLTHPSLAHGLEFLFAWPSLGWGMLLLPLIYALGRKLFEPRIALLALWLAAVNPFHLWYSQEVRMYTLGAGLALMCLWAALKWMEADKRQKAKGKTEQGSGDSAQRIPEVAAIPHSAFRILPHAWLIVYVVSATAGLYTLYYFAFFLIALTLLIIPASIFLTRHRPSPQLPIKNRQSKIGTLLPWLFAQLAVLVLWVPWLPVFWRQMTEPPVPPWREQTELLVVLRQSLAALVVGQSPPLGAEWLWAGMAGLSVLPAIFIYTKNPGATATTQSTQAPPTTHQPPPTTHHPPPTTHQPPPTIHTPLLVLLAVFLPLLLIYALSVLVTPLYHVRYFFIYAAPAPLLLAAGLGSLAQYRRWLGAAALTLLLLVSGWSLVEFWANPLYRADDHRAAVADLAAAWRPGDAILVNAGWVYPVLEIYWPKALRGPDDALPPPLDRRLRLPDYANKNAGYQNSSDQPMLLTAGSVGGAPSLGWGLAESDFYATTAGETAHALMAIAARAPRIWHYRLYDTVNDPGGLVRDVLAGMGERRLDRPYPGRDYLRVQLFETAAAQQPDLCPRAPSPHVRFGRSLNLLGHATPSTATAGRVLYTTLCWEALDGIGDFPAGLSTSLRLYRRDPTGDRLVAQADAAPLLTTAAWPAGQIYRQPLALPLPASLPPGPYDLALIVYNTQDGAPLSPAGNGAIHGQRWPLTQVDVRLPLEPPPAGAPLARFDYIDLLAATVGRREAAPGDTIDVSLIWRPRPNQYRDTYDAVFFLIGAQTSQTWDGAPGGPAYPSGDWAPNYPVQEWETLQLSLDLPPGEYTLSVRLERANDGLPIPAHPGPLPWQQVDVFEIGRVKVR